MNSERKKLICGEKSVHNFKNPSASTRNPTSSSSIDLKFSLATLCTIAYALRKPTGCFRYPKQFFWPLKNKHRKRS